MRPCAGLPLSAGRVCAASCCDTARTTLELASGALGQFPVGIGDHQIDAIKAPLCAVEDELRPAGLGLTIAHLESQQLTLAIAVPAHRPPPRRECVLLCLALPPIEIGGIRGDVGLASLLTDATHLRLGDAALGGQG